MPLRIWVIGSRTSSAPSGNSIGAPAGATGAGARGAGGADAGPAEPLPPGPAGAAGGRGRGAASADRLDDLQDVLAGDPATATGALDLGRGEVVLAQEPPDGGRHAGIRVGDGRWRGGGGRSGGRGHLGRAALVTAGGTGGHGRRRRG